MDQRQHMETSIMDGLLPVSEDKQRRCRLAPPDQQESTETKLVDVHSHRTTAQGSQDTTDSTQDGHRGKTSTLPKKENQGARELEKSCCTFVSIVRLVTFLLSCSSYLGCFVYRMCFCSKGRCNKINLRLVILRV